MPTYQELLKDQRWQFKRVEILRRDNFTCQYCQTTGEVMHVHHMYYDFDLMPWEYDNTFLITLCAICHENEEFHKNFTIGGVAYLTQLGFLHTDLSDMISAASHFLDANEDVSFTRHYIEKIKQTFRNG